MKSCYRAIVSVLVLFVGCVAETPESASAQAIAGPTGLTVTPRTVDHLSVSWTAVPTAFKYYLFQAPQGQPLAYVASLVDSSGAPPPTSYIATGLTPGVSYCFAVSAVFPNNTESDLSTTVCSPGETPPPSAVHTRIVPVVPPTDGVVVALFAQVSGLESNPATGPSNLYVPLPLVVGETLVNVRARVQDGGPTRVQPTLLRQTDGPPTQTLASVLAGPVSSGSGAEETLSFSPNIVVGGGTQYVVKFANVAGFLTTSIFRLEIDVRP